MDPTKRSVRSTCQAIRSLAVRRAREDAGLSQRALARVATALGRDLSVRLHPGTGPLIRDHIQAAMVEAQSELRRLEQQLRWSKAKADARSQARGRPVSRLLLLRSTRRTRALVSEFAGMVRAAFPGPTARGYEALTEAQPWPGESIAWCAVAHGQARITDTPPRSVGVGR